MYFLKLIFIALLHFTVEIEPNSKTEEWPKSPAENIRGGITDKEQDDSSRLINAPLLLSKKWPPMSEPQNTPHSVENISDSHSLYSLALKPKAPSFIQNERKNTNTSSEPSAILPKPVSSPKPYLTLSKSHDVTARGERVVPLGKQNKTYVTGEYKLAGITKPSEVASDFNETANNSTGRSASKKNDQPSQVLSSVGAVNGPQIQTANVSEHENGANKTVNQSAVLLSSTREIHVVIIAHKSTQNSSILKLPVPRSADRAPNRRFPSSLPSLPNGTVVGARRLLPVPYPFQQYWPVYLTLTLLGLGVLFICMVCCTRQGRRDMSISLPKTVQYGQQLPPYSYAFSHEMRQAESQETAHLNPSPKLKPDV